MTTLVLAALLLTLGFVPAGLPAPADSAGACAARVAVLGANMSAGGRFEVQRALAGRTVLDVRPQVRRRLPPPPRAVSPAGACHARRHGQESDGAPRRSCGHRRFPA